MNSLQVLNKDAREVVQLSEEQSMMREAAQRFCKEQSDAERARSLMTAKQGYDSDVWQQIADMGWLGVMVPSQYGGADLGVAELVPVLEEMGRRILSSPIQAVAMATQALVSAGTEQQKAEWLPKIVEGSVVTVGLNDANHWNFAKPTCQAKQAGDQLQLSGKKYFVRDADTAEALIATVQLNGAAALVLIPREAINDDAIERQQTIDEVVRCFRVNLDEITIPASNILDDGDASVAIQTIAAVGTLLLSAEMTGGLAAALDLIVDYALTRKTFGKLIGSYQGIKHPTADILCHYEHARGLLYGAAHESSKDLLSYDNEILVRMLKAWIGDKYSYAGDRAVQFHGGIGFTYECNAQIFLRRAQFGQSQFGDAPHHRKALAKLLLD